MRCAGRKFLFFGGGKRDRTADLLHAMQALSQLSYTPRYFERARIIVMRLMLVKPKPIKLVISPSLAAGKSQARMKGWKKDGLRRAATAGGKSTIT